MINKMKLLEQIRADAYRRSPQGDFKFLCRLFRTDPAFRFTVLFRSTIYFGKKSVLGFFFNVLYSRCKHKYGIQIPLTSKLGQALLMPHFGGIVVNSEAVIGDNCTILHGVTIGSVLNGVRAGSPTLESHVYVGPNAVIVGRVRIGCKSTIAPGALVNFDVPSGSLVVGNPGAIVRTLLDADVRHIKHAHPSLPSGSPPLPE